MRHIIYLLIIQICLITNLYGQNEHLYSSAVSFLKEEIVKKSDLRSFFKKELSRRTKLSDFQVSDTIVFQDITYFMDELSYFDEERVERFESYYFDLFKSDEHGNGLILSFSRPIDQKYLLAELTTVKFRRMNKVKFGKLARLLFKFNESGEVIGFYSKEYICN